MAKDIAWYAETYIQRYGFSLVMIEPNQKHTNRQGWGDNTLDTVEAAREFYTSHKDWNVAAELGKSRLCSLDIDCDESFQLLLAEFGFDYAELDKYPTIQGASKGKRIMFRVPEGAQLPYTKLNWPSKLDPTGDKHRALLRKANEHKKNGELEEEEKTRFEAKKFAKYTVFELRAADVKHRLDMLPPSRHPDTGKPYKWIVQPPKSNDWPTPPEWLLNIWTLWDKLGEQFKEACPWLPEPEQPTRKQASTRTPQNDDKANEVVSTFIQQYPLESMLETYGYVRKGKRYLSPHSTTKLPGVHILNQDKCWVHHASDPLCSEDSGQPVSSYDLYVEYEHRGDKSKAFKEAAKLLGIELKRQPLQYHPENIMPEPEPDFHEPEIDFDPFIYLGGEPTAVAELEEYDKELEFVDFVTPLPWCNSKGVPANYHENLEEICRRLGVVVRYNVIKKEEELLIPRKGFSQDNQANAALYWLVSKCALFGFPIGKVPEFITLIADSNPYNPVAAWVNSKPWDGVSRLNDLFDTVTTEDSQTDLKNALIKRWMLSAIAAAFSNTGVSAHGVLVFQGKQNLGKTSWVKSLVPDDLNLVKDSVLLRPDDKDSVVQACSYWLCELGELDATFKKSDIAALKAFITSDKDVIRLPYARKASTFARRTVFFGSVNPKQFLHDPTGNRRYWTVECQALNYTHGLDMQQIWAEVYQMWKEGEQHYLTPDELELLNEHNEEYTVSDPTEDKIATQLDWDAVPAAWEWLTPTQICERIGIDRATQSDTIKIGIILNKRELLTKKIKGRKHILCPPAKW